MEHVVLVIHLMLALAITGLVLLQRSEGGGLGMGGGGMGGFSSPQATANALTKATAFCAAFFFATSLTLGILANAGSSGTSILDKVGETVPVVEETAEEIDLEAIKDAVKDSVSKQQSDDTETPQEPKVPISE